MALKYLIDENVDPIYTIQLRRFQPDLFVMAVGDLTTPQKGWELIRNIYPYLLITT
ncbi:MULTISPECIES: hypothetical protein [Cyanophyceae]|uniref:hypothetical protein n=1 Tax=Cyanophyceae TaxID=3028117 RepID=UPI0023302371|nr:MULTISPECIES: hypothetical protein [Cyanophyceae]MDB9354684.1 hypothetical protein [Nodularia spumigena CS-587/03]MDB9318814.1 hypothetical protein [Nodularia spumigena CS-590/01A]MDB9322802.1 hypothetical protein [Nodularia spumigena CS-591/07A]MDB9325711.1 hypothetical protein [Nodularia spumigena CS-590/02]MDB9330590.1 hypothetical protein [Nodularia spumigena CS-591/04]